MTTLIFHCMLEQNQNLLDVFTKQLCCNVYFPSRRLSFQFLSLWSAVIRECWDWELFLLRNLSELVCLWNIPALTKIHVFVHVCKNVTVAHSSILSLTIAISGRLGTSTADKQCSPSPSPALSQPPAVFSWGDFLSLRQFVCSVIGSLFQVFVQSPLEPM